MQLSINPIPQKNGKWVAGMVYTWGIVDLQTMAGLLVDDGQQLTADGRTGVICIFLCFAVGLSNLFHVSIMILFGALCL
jgi:hypothetical protein